MMLFLAILLVVCFIFVDTDWLYRISLVEQMAYYHFLHANVFHLAANMLAGYYAFKRCTVSRVVTAYLIASLSFLCVADMVIGFSNIVYAMIGLKTPAFSHPWWRHPGTITFLVVSLLMVFLPNVSAVTHIISFCGGMAVSMISRGVQQIKNDSARYI